MSACVTLLCFTPSPRLDVAQGLLGIASLEFGEALLIDGVAVRRTRAGRLYLAFPSRVLRTGERRHVVRPVDAEARRLIEEQVFAQLRAKGVLA